MTAGFVFDEITKFWKIGPVLLWVLERRELAAPICGLTASHANPVGRARALPDYDSDGRQESTS